MLLNVLFNIPTHEDHQLGILCDIVRRFEAQATDGRASNEDCGREQRNQQGEFAAKI